MASGWTRSLLSFLPIVGKLFGASYDLSRDTAVYTDYSYTEYGEDEYGQGGLVIESFSAWVVTGTTIQYKTVFRRDERLRQFINFLDEELPDLEVLRGPPPR